MFDDMYHSLFYFGVFFILFNRSKDNHACKILLKFPPVPRQKILQTKQNFFGIFSLQQLKIVL